jgi:hypothetical protein
MSAGSPIVVHQRQADVIVDRPDADTAGELAVMMATSFARARRDRAGVALLRPRQPAAEALFALTPADAPHRVEPTGLSGVWWRARWALEHGRMRTAAAARAMAASFWLETYRELRRHVGDERLPYALRAWLRDSSHVAMGRSRERDAAAHPFPRRLLREPTAVRLPEALRADAAAYLAGRGIREDRPLALLQTGPDPERFRQAALELAAAGYQIVRFDAGVEPWRQGLVIDLYRDPNSPAVADVHLLLSAAFVVCVDADVQRIAYLTDTPTLALNAIDPFASYPVRRTGLFTLATPVDLDTGVALTPAEMLSERYLRNVHRFGHRRNTAAQIAASVREMRARVSGAASDSGEQTRFHDAALERGVELRPHVARVAQWGPDGGFLGDGRLVAWQAALAS